MCIRDSSPAAAPARSAAVSPAPACHVEIDLVGHEGGNARGEFCFTLTVTDIAKGWTENRSVRNKAQTWVFAALMDITKVFGFPIIGIVRTTDLSPLLSLQPGLPPQPAAALLPSPEGHLHPVPGLPGCARRRADRAPQLSWKWRRKTR